MIEDSQEFIVLAEEAGMRLDLFLARRFASHLSRTYFQSLISNEGAIEVNGKALKKGRRLEAGDHVEVTLLPLPELELKPEPIPLHILYEDSQLLVINKPAGMLVHPAPGYWSGTVVNALLYHYRELFSLQEMPWEAFRPGIVHRLDKETSGALLIAKNGLVHRQLTRLFSERLVKKEYLAVCIGNPGSGSISAAIGRHPTKRQEMALVKEGGREAVTEFETLASRGDFSLVLARPLTGRTHQIRLHLRAKGAPILGDSLYGNSSLNRKWEVSRQLLHAYRLTFIHPITGEKLCIEAPLPEDFLKWKEKLSP